MCNPLKKILAQLVVAICLWYWPAKSHADLYLPGGAYLFTHSGYNYAPSVINGTSIDKLWWCGYGVPPGQSTSTDVIYYTIYDRGTQKWGSATQVLAPSAGQWDGVFACDPSVVQGVFSDPDNGMTYGYAMYFTGTNNPAGAGTVNSIGVAFSNDGINWVKYSKNPIIRQQVSVQGTYGVGQPATYNVDGRGGIFLFYTDTSTSAGSRLWVSAATDGIRFGPPTLLSNQSSDGESLCTNSDIAYDYITRYFYAAIENCDTIRPGDRETYQFGLYRISGDLLVSGQGVWEPLAYINTNMTGFDLNHSPGLGRDGFGNVTSGLPLISAYFAGGQNEPSTWNLTLAGWTGASNTLAFGRYANPAIGHWVTTGYVSPGFSLESVLGYLFMTKQTNTQPLYGCETSDLAHHFISLDSACEGQRPLGVNGWIYSAPDLSVATTALYRCAVVGGDHFVSRDPLCEGQVVENGGQPLGYAKISP